MLDRKEEPQEEPRRPSATKIILKYLSLECASQTLSHVLSKLPAHLVPVAPEEYKTTKEKIIEGAADVVTATAVEDAIFGGIKLDNLGLLAGSFLAKLAVKNEYGSPREFNLAQDAKQIGMNTLEKMTRGLIGELRLSDVEQVPPEKLGIGRRSAHAVVNSGLGCFLGVTLAAPEILPLLPPLFVISLITVITNTIIDQPRGAERQVTDNQEQQNNIPRLGH